MVLIKQVAHYQPRSYVYLCNDTLQLTDCLGETAQRQHSAKQRLAEAHRVAREVARVVGRLAVIDDAVEESSGREVAQC